jgi:hypothetical protein
VTLNEADEISPLLRFIESPEPEVSGRSRLALSTENEDLILPLGEARLPDDKKEEIMVLLVSSSQVLEMLAAILKRDQKEEDPSKAGHTSL